MDADVILTQAVPASGSADQRGAGPTADRFAAEQVRASTGLITSDGCARSLRPSRQREPPPPRARSRFQLLLDGPWKSEGFRLRAVLLAGHLPFAQVRRRRALTRYAEGPDFWRSSRLPPRARGARFHTLFVPGRRRPAPRAQRHRETPSGRR